MRANVSTSTFRSRNGCSKLPAMILLATALCTEPALADTKTWTAAGDRLVLPVGVANPAMRSDHAVGTTFYDITWYGTGYMMP